MKLRALRNNFLFAFIEKQNKKGYFIEQTNWGFEMYDDKNPNGLGHTAFDKSVKQGRWGKVLTIGPECEIVKVGDYVCLEPQMWTNSFTYDDVMIRRSDETQVMIISEEKPDVYVK